MTNLIITGGLGFIGTAFLRKYRDRFNRVVVLDNLLPQVHRKTMKRFSEKDVEFYCVDISLLDSLSRIDLSGSFDFIHMASETGTGESFSKSNIHLSTNALGTLNLFRWVQAQGININHIINLSSRAVYGEGTYIIGNKERCPPQRKQFVENDPKYLFSNFIPHNSSQNSLPTSIYGSTKLFQENIINNLFTYQDTKVTHLRLQNVIGKGQSPDNPYTGVIPFFINRLKRGEVIEVYEDGQIIRDFIDVKDVANEIYFHLIEPDNSRNLFNVGSGLPISILKLAENIVNMNGAGKIQVTGGFRVGDVRNAYCQPDLKSKQLIPFETTLKEIVNENS